MSALARYLHAQGWEVAGYDRTSTPLTDELQREGMSVAFAAGPESLPAGWADAPPPLVIYTPAVPEDLPLRQYLARKTKLYKRSELLGSITRSHPTLAVAGTHGKTTTTTLLAHLLADRCNAFLGGISAATGRNLHLSEGAEWTVVEADEFDRSFWQLFPSHAAITSLDADHLDIYGTDAAFEEGFQRFASQTQSSLLLHHSIAARFQPAIPFSTYGIEEGELHAVEVRQTEGTTEFTLVLANGARIEGMRLPMPGLHNLENALAASGLALRAGLSPDDLKSRMASFQGIHRRFQYHIRSESTVYIDDYAHHPVELKRTLEAVRWTHPGRPVTAIFQPHLFSRTRDHLDAFAAVLSTVDHLILLPIYPARELPIPGIDSQSLFEKISGPTKVLVPAERIFDCLKSIPSQVVLTLGAGDIDRWVNPLKEWLLAQANTHN